MLAFGGVLHYRGGYRVSSPVEVVLPEPCRPTISSTLGGSLAKRNLDSWLPRILINSSRTILMTCWDGDSAISTSSPMAFCLMFSMSCLTTRKLTSASSKATRISRRADSMFSGDSLPSPRRFLKTRCNLSDRLSNMKFRRRQGRPRRRAFIRFFHYTFYYRLGARLDGVAAKMVGCFVLS